jgi:hypothetical protein
MKRRNIRTVNGAAHNPHLESRYRQVQNRAAAVLDASDEVDNVGTLDLIAHLHRISIDKIKKDLYGEPTDIEKRFGIKSTAKLEHTLNKCLKELNSGVNEALVAVAHHVPFMLLRTLQEERNVKEVASTFLRDIEEKLDLINEQNTAKRIDDAVQVRYS